MKQSSIKSKILFRGAEALIILDKGKIIKRRVKKSYRLNELDERIRKLRTRSEIRLLEKASKLIPVPKIIKVDKKEILMEFIRGKKLSDELESFSEKQQLKIFRQIGENIAKIHDSEIVHGDLTTSNMIFNEKNNKVYFIDFGLGFGSHKIEDKAVDLHLLKQALEAKHFNTSKFLKNKNSGGLQKHKVSEGWKKLFDEVLKGYKISKDYKKVFERLKKVEKRGRYKEQY